MQHKPIDLNIATPVLPVLRMYGVRGDAARSPPLAPCMIPAVDVSVSNAAPPLILHTISKLLHKAALTFTVVLLSSSRPRVLLPNGLTLWATFVAFRDSNNHKQAYKPADNLSKMGRSPKEFSF